MARSGPVRFRVLSDRPLYSQVVESLRREVSSMAPGDRIDSETQLTKRFGVSRFTVARAIEILVDEGRVNRRQGLGSFVAPPPLKRAPTYLLSFSEAIAAAGRVPSHRLLAFGEVPRNDSLPYAADARLIGLERVRFVDGVATAIHRSVISADVAEKIGLTRDVAALPNFSLYRLFDQAGLFAARGVEILRARAALPAEAKWLSLPKSEAPVVMSVCRQTFAEDGTILDVGDSVYDARRYAYEAEILRDRGAASRECKPQNSGEKDNASNTDARHDFGPRLGPWDTFDRGGD